MVTTENENHFFDTPDHQVGLTSSIGGLWPPERASFARIKGFYTGGIITGSCEDFQTTFVQCVNEIGRGGISRVQLRAIYSGEFIRSISQNESMQQYVEAIIPLDPGYFGEEPVLVYLSHNGSDRQPNALDFETVQQNMVKTRSDLPRSVEDMLRRPAENGYAIDILNILPHQPDDHIIDQMFSLYARFGWGRKEVKQILFNPYNIIGVARFGNDIVSAGIAELAFVPVGDSVLRIVEITEAATLSEHERRGVYAGVSTTLLRELADRSRNRSVFSGELDLVFGEGNGLSRGVMRVARIQGRTFATEVGGRYGFPESGILRQQVPINGVSRRTPYNDLVPAFLTRSGLYRY